MRLCLATFFLAATAENLDLWADHHLLVTENFKNKIGDNHTSELSLYLKSPVIPLQQNPIRWWDTNDITNSFPILAKIALKYLGSMATSVPSERLFSKAGQIVTQQRNRLKGKRVSQVLFFQSIDKIFWDF
jgi:hypothetical protein